MFEKEDIWILAAAWRDDFDDYHRLTEIAAKITLALSPSDMRDAFAEHVRDLIGRGDHGLLIASLVYMAKHAPKEGIPIPRTAVTDALVCDGLGVNEAARALLGRLEMRAK